MSVVKVKCPVCGSENVSKNGTLKVGKQQYICNNKQCHKSSFILDYTYNACKSEVKNKIIPMTLNGSDIKDISRMLTDNICVDMIKVEIDELWSFVKNKKKQKWSCKAHQYCTT